MPDDGSPRLWVHVNPEVPQVPQIGLVVPIDGQTRIFEACMLWYASKGDRTRLVPDSFTYGAYRFDDDLGLRHVAKAPARTFKAAEPGMILAYRCLREIEAKQLDRTETFKLPELARAA